MAIVADTTVLIDVLRSEPAAVEWLSNVDAVPICSEVTRTEVLRGVRSSERRATASLLSRLRWMSVDEPISWRAGELGREFRRSHQGLALADLLIAATVLELGAQLATSNVRHYPMFPGLRPAY